MDDNRQVKGIEVVPNRVVETYRSGGDYGRVLREEVARGREALAAVAERRASDVALKSKSR